ncbi:MAG: DUF2691 family protein [bacterium]|nr:DUF2691 family protein [bacterium]
MKRYISTQDREGYTQMLEIVSALGGSRLGYKWLITDVEAYPQDGGKYDELIENNSYIILSNAEFLNMLSECNFQWIWAVFSAIPEKISNEEILKYSLPYAAENEEIYKDDVAIIQHPLADIEIVAEDSSSVFIVSKDEQMAEKFKNLFPMSRTNY